MKKIILYLTITTIIITAAVRVNSFLEDLFLYGLAYALFDLSFELSTKRKK